MFASTRLRPDALADVCEIRTYCMLPCKKTFLKCRSFMGFVLHFRFNMEPIVQNKYDSSLLITGEKKTYRPKQTQTPLRNFQSFIETSLGR